MLPFGIIGIIINQSIKYALHMVRTQEMLGVPRPAVSSSLISSSPIAHLYQIFLLPGHLLTTFTSTFNSIPRAYKNEVKTP
jgi:hypothetical protein